MIQSDFDQFADAIDATMNYYDKPISADMTSLFFEDLADYPLESVLAGLKLHRRNPERGQFVPKVADVVREVQNFLKRKWLSADEAWAKALIASDESVTIVWTDEAQYAYGMCKPIMDEGDMVGARMAFKQAYDRAVSKAVAEMRAPNAFISLGHDQEGRVNAITEAVSVGLLTQDRAAPFLIESQTKIAQEGKAIAGLLTGNVIAHPASKEHFIKRMAELKNAIKATKSPEEIRADLEAIKRADREQRKAETLEALRGQL